MATEKGVIKKTCLADYRNVRKDGIIAINIDEGNRLIGVRLTNGSDDVMLITSNGRYPSVCRNTDSLKIERWTGCEWKLKHLPESPARRYCRH